MNLQISGHHVEVTKALKEYVAQKLDPVIRHFDKVTGVNVVLSVEKLKQKAEVTVHVPGKDRQVLKYKQKMQDHHRGDKIANHIDAE
jgi:putative sigma-54 modulation protein